jgi:hypothetical protein
MDKKKLKAILKPLVEECIREAMFEKGLLSKIIEESITGASKALLKESTQNYIPETSPTVSPNRETQKQKLTETRKRLMGAMGKEAYKGVDIFEDVKPMRGDSSAGPSYSPLQGVEPGDRGVDISLLPGVGKWNKMIN